MTQLVVKIFTGTGQYELMAAESQAVELCAAFAQEVLRTICASVLLEVQAKPLCTSELRRFSMRLPVSNFRHFALQAATIDLCCWQTDSNTVTATIAIVSIDPGELHREAGMFAAIETARHLLHELAQPVQALCTFAALLKKKLSIGYLGPDEKLKHWSHSICDQTSRLMESLDQNRSLYTAPVLDDLLLPRKDLQAFVSLSLFHLGFLTKAHAIELKCSCTPVQLHMGSSLLDSQQNFSASYIRSILYWYCCLLGSNAGSLLSKSIEIRIAEKIHLPLPFAREHLEALQSEPFRPKKLDLGLSMRILNRLCLLKNKEALLTANTAWPEFQIGI